MTLYAIIGIALACSTIMLVHAEIRSRSIRRFIFKPLSAVLMIAIILISLPGNQQINFAILLLFGMLLCAGGDIALLFESKRAFTIGLILFLLGHIVYTITIARFDGLALENWIISLCLAVAAIAMFAFLFPGLGKMKIPVFLYIVAISLMVHTAIMTIYSDYFNHNQAIALTCGALLFFLSDIMLAVNRFRAPFKYNRVSLLFYFGGQYLIGLSAALG